MNWVNATVAIAVVFVIGVSNAVTWAVTRLRNACDHYTARHASSGGPPIFTGPPVVQDMPPSTDMDPAGPTRPDIRWELTS